MNFTWNSSANVDQTQFARFILKQSALPEIQSLRTEALNRYLPAEGLTSFSGYEENVWSQVKALYDTLLTHHPSFHYTLEPQHRFVSPIAQEVRSVEKILTSGEANCIEIVSLLSALLLHIGLNPLVLIAGDKDKKNPTHALIGFWLNNRINTQVKISSEALINNLALLGICELTGLLQQPRLPFSSAVLAGAHFIPEETRNEIQIPE